MRPHEFYTSLTPHNLYRICFNADREELRGKPVVFLRYEQRPFDTKRAVVKLVDGEGGEWFVSPAILVDL